MAFTVKRVTTTLIIRPVAHLADGTRVRYTRPENGARIAGRLQRSAGLTRIINADGTVVIPNGAAVEVL